jgi:hypothetical protein
VKSSHHTRLATLLIAISIGLAAGCGDDDDETTPVQPPAGPPKVSITAIRTTSGASFEVASGAQPVIEAGCDPDKTLNVDLALENFTRRPPGGCGGLPQCGTVIVSVERADKRKDVRSTAVSVPVPLAGPPFEPFEPGEYLFKVELHDSENKLITIAGAESTDELKLQVNAPASCGANDGGADASDGATTDAGVDADASDAPPDVSSDAPADTDTDAHDAATDHDGSDGPADAATDGDQG